MGENNNKENLDKRKDSPVPQPTRNQEPTAKQGADSPKPFSSRKRIITAEREVDKSKEVILEEKMETENDSN